MTLPIGVPKLLRVVKNGSGGPNNDSIPVKEDLGGASVGYLKNETQVWIVNPSYADISKYRKTWNGSTWVCFEPVDTTLFAGQNDIWCEENSHLFAVEPVPEPEPELPGEWVEFPPIKYEGGKWYYWKAV